MPQSPDEKNMHDNLNVSHTTYYLCKFGPEKCLLARYTILTNESRRMVEHAG